MSEKEPRNVVDRDTAVGRFIVAIDEARNQLICNLSDRSDAREDARLVLQEYKRGGITEDGALDKLGFSPLLSKGPMAE
jgi:hypothetical protein